MIASRFPFDPSEFADKRVLVTGGTQGMGEAIVRRLAVGGVAPRNVKSRAGCDFCVQS